MNVQSPDIADKKFVLNALRTLTMDTVQAANSGRPGEPMGQGTEAAEGFAPSFELFVAPAGDLSDHFRISQVTIFAETTRSVNGAAQ